MKLRHVANISLFALVFLIPFGTRQIWSYGIIGDIAVEWGAISLYGTQILVLLFFVLSVAASGWLATRKALFHPMSAATGVLAFISAVSAAMSPVGAYGGSFAAALWVALGWLVVVAMLALRPPLKMVYWGLFLAASIQAVLAISQFLMQATFSSKWLGMAVHQASSLGTYVVDTGAGRWLRAYGSFGHPNVLGFFLVIGIISSFALVLSGLGVKGRIFVWTGLKFIGSGLLFSLSKSAILAGFAAMAACLVASLLTGRKVLIRTVVLVSVMVLAGFLAVSFLVFDLAKARITAVSQLEVRSWNERISLTADALMLYQKYPLLGVGPGQMPVMVYQEASNSRSPWSYQPVHNVPLLLAAEIGLIGLLAWLSLVGLLIVRVVSKVRFDRKFKNEPESMVGPIVILSLIVSGLVVSLFDHFLWSLWPGQLLFWLILSIVYLGTVTKNKEEQAIT